MYPKQNQQQNEDDNNRKIKPVRRGAPNNRSRNPSRLPQSENVSTPSPSSEGAPLFRAMTMQSPEPQLVFRHAPEQQKEGLVHHVQLSQDTSKKQQPVVPQLQVHEQPPRVDVQLVLNTESQPCFGWDISKIQIEPVPFYFPRDMLQWENFPFQDLPRVLERISREMRKSSVQASLIHEPLSAKLQTCHENVELYLVFFRENTTNSDDDGTVSMSVQRHKGNHYAANKCIQRLVDAAKGLHEEEDDDDDDDDNDDNENKDMDTDTSVTADAVVAMERLIERAEMESASATQNNRNDQDQRHPFLDQTPEQMTESTVRDVYGWLEQSHRLDLRRHALEYLLAMTDLKRTLSSQAIAGSLIVLQGKVSPSTTTAAAATTTSSELNTQAQAIQSILLSVLLTRELPGDRAMFMEGNNNKGSSSNNNGTDDLEMHPYFPEVDNEINANSVGLPDYYTEYMNELFHLALQILVQSLEVVACFSNSIRGGNILSVGESLTKQLLDTASDVADGKDLYHMLLGCIVNAESKLANGYLACKALRLLALDHPGIKEQMKLDINAKQCIGNAYQVGQVRHTLLKDESYQLWQTVCQQ